MLSHRSIIAIVFLAAAATGPPAGGGDVASPPAALRPERPLVRPTAYWGPGATPRIPVQPAPAPDRAEPLPAPAVAQPVPETVPPSDPGYPTADELPAPTPSDFPAGLTLENLEDIAWQANPTLVQARMAVRAAQGKYVQARLYPNPTIGYAGGDVGIEGTSGQQGAVFGQEFVTAGKRQWESAVASCQVQQARHGLEAQQWRVLNDVRSGYYDVLIAQRMVELNDELVRVGHEGVDVTEKLKANLEVSQADVLQARIEADSADLGLYEASQHHRAVWRQLAAVLGRPDMEVQPLEGDLTEDLPELTWEDTLRKLLARSPELAEARAAVRAARNEVGLARAERHPNFEIGLGAKYDASALGGLADVELSVPLPLYDRNQGGIIEAEAGLIASEHEVRRIELDLRNRLAEAFQQYANSREQVDVYTRSILPNARASLELVRTGYREGEFGYLTLLTAQRTFFDVNLNYLTSLRELWARIVEIEGMLLTGGLEGLE